MKDLEVADTPCTLRRDFFVYFLVHISVLTFVYFDFAPGVSAERCRNPG